MLVGALVLAFHFSQRVFVEPTCCVASEEADFGYCTWSYCNFNNISVNSSSPLRVMINLFKSCNDTKQSVTCTVFSCWACNVVTWFPAVPTTGFSSDLPPIVTTLNCGAGDLMSPEVCETPGLLPVWGNCSTIGCPDFPMAVTKSFCPSCLMTCG